MRLPALAVLAVLGGLAAPTRTAAQPPKLPDLPPHLMAPTDPLSPAEERKRFTLPSGFDAQLVASEPDIQKPMQMAFDAKGRLWVTTSYHYPFAAPPGKGTDKLFVLSDIDPVTGKAGKVQVFASDLNIPIGVLPLPDGKGVLVSSAGEIRKYTIAEAGDGPKNDGYEVLFSGFGYRDTHGMYNSFTLMPDGWVYACHGFANDSTVKGKDGHEVKMNSGHTFRFRPDGSRIEVYTRGQVNPFGMAIDPWLNLYTADCHSKPITQLIPGACYDSFGKPHDGLGYGPHVTRHDHGSTGLCGLAWYDADHFPPEYLGTMFVGNVVTNRINFDKIEWRGASPVAQELPDFLVSQDRWFRPVDIKLGPDGALYVADFYNKIIGHYEVDLRDPRRDKDRGRIWRIVWKGAKGQAAGPRFHRDDFSTAQDAELFSDLLHPNLTVRFLAGHQLLVRAAAGRRPQAGDDFGAELQKQPDRMASVAGWLQFLAETAGTATPESYAALIKYARDQKLSGEQLTGQMVRALTSREKWGQAERQILLDVFTLFDSVHQRRAAVEAVIFHPHADFIDPLLAVLKKADADDTHLRHAARIALRNCLRDAESWPRDFDPVYADIALAIPNGRAAGYLVAHLNALPGRLATVAEHVARHGTGDQRDELFARLARPESTQADPEPLLAAFRGLQAVGVRLSRLSAEALVKGAERAATAASLVSPNPTPADVKTALWGLRVLNALPTVLDRRPNAPIIAPSAATTDHLAAVVGSPNAPAEVRLAAVEALLRYAPEAGLRAGRKQLGDPATPEAVRNGLLLAFAATGNKDARLVARDALKDAPYRTAVAVGAALAATPAGADDLLTAVKTGQAPARLLQEKAILERLRTANIRDLDRQVADLTRGLPPADARIAGLIQKRAATFASFKPDKERGAKVFTQHCAACHRIADQGGKIAPQLDGIGVRGLERLLEDTLDPNRNVDQAFRARVVVTKDEKTVTGLMLRVEGEVLVLADGEGKEVRIPTADIATNRETMLSPMPANFADVIPEAEFAHLMAYLLDQKAPALKQRE